jgi:hypothetical protein
MVHDYSFFGSTVDFVIKKKGTSDKNMTVELDSPASTPSKNWM